MREVIQNILMRLVDGVTAVVPRSRPGASALAACRLVSHRGEHDNHTVFENTLPAFAAARAAGVWGIECDIRWTRDLVPVVVHDPDTRRVFGNDAVIAEQSFTALRQSNPLIPSLAELVADFGGNTHLMIEIKAEYYPQPERQAEILSEHLAGLTPVADYHFLALDAELFRHVAFAPTKTFLPVAEFNVGELSRQSIDRAYGGLTGHYVLLTGKVSRRHRQMGQDIGTGHIGSRNALFREINRDVRWIFSNDAVAMQQVVDQALAGREPG